MDEQIKLWLDKEMSEMQKEIKKLNQKLMKKVPLWMALSVTIMVGIGLLAGYDFSYILKVHFLIGCGIAAFIWLCFYLQTKSTSIKKVRIVYENAIEKLKKDKEEMESFTNQVEKDRYEVVTFHNPTTDKYPARLLVGEEFWLYCRYPSCTIIKVDDIEETNIRKDMTKVGYDVGNTHINQNISVGVSLIICYKNKKEDDIIFLGNQKQVEQAKKLIKKYEKENSELFS